MAMKELLYRLQPAQVYVVLALSIAYFLIQLYLSHISHALTLLVDSYHMLCNIVALSGCIITIKQCNDSNNSRNHIDQSDGTSSTDSKTKGNFQSIFSKTSDNNKFIEVNEAEVNRHERSLRNTFGWMRIEILTMLISMIFLAAFIFSLLVEAVQTLVHISHQDTMHYAVAVFTTGIGGLILNGFCYFLIGGYTYHQSSFLHLTEAGDVVVEQVATRDGLYHGSRSLAKIKRNDNVQGIAAIQSTTSSIQLDEQQANPQPNPTPSHFKRTHTFKDILRDISSMVFVLICSAIVHSADNENVTKFVDPIISIISGITLLVLSYPYMKESCFILLQTIPASIDIEVFKTDLLKTFDDIVSVHDLHIWQMTHTKYVSTVHILFHNPIVYVNIKDQVVNFFHAQGITIVTIQPEFKTKSRNANDNMSLAQCLIGCQSLECAPKTCCSTTDLEVLIDSDEKLQRKSKKSKMYHRKSSSMLSLNVTSLVKLRKLTGSTQDIIKKSVSESHVIRLGSDDSINSAHTSTDPSSNTPSTAHNLYAIHDSISELKEIDFHDECDERAEQRLPPPDQHPQSPQIGSISEHEDSSLLDKSCNQIAKDAMTQLSQNQS